MTVLGAQYYRPPNPPREDWRRDLERMKEAGLNTVKLWACWSWINVRRGRHDFGDLDELIAHAGDVGLSVVINIIIENAPYWLEAAAPHTRYTDNEGRVIRLTAAMNTPGGGWPGLCFDNHEVWEAAREFLATLIQRYDGIEAVVAWDVWNEPHLEPASYFPDRMYCYCDASVAKFVAWLAEKYVTLDALNAAWSRRYSDWSQVQQPQLFEAVPDLIDWREFWFDNLTHWLQRRTEAARNWTAKTVMTHVALSGFTGQLATHTLDEFELTDHVDTFGTSSFPTWLMADDHAEHLFNLDTARDAAKGKPFWQAELQGGRGRRDGRDSTGQPRPEAVTLWMWNALAAGASGVMFWQWRPELLGPESPGYGLCTPGGESTDRVKAVTAFASVADLPILDGRTTVRSSIGLLVSRKTALHAFATDRTMDLYRDAVLGVYRMLLDQDLDVTFIHEEQLARDGVPDHVRVIYWPMPAVCGDATIERLADFVRDGGRLVAEASPGEYTETGHRRTRVPARELRDVFGVDEIETTTVDGAESIRTFGGSIALGWQKERISVGAASVIARFADGTPAITENRAETGVAILIAGYPSVAYAATPSTETGAAVRELLALPSDRRPSWREPLPGRVTRRATSATGAPLLFAINWTDSAAELLNATDWTCLANSSAETEAEPLASLVAPMSALLLKGPRRRAV